MSIRFIDSCDHYSTNELALKYNVIGFSPSISAGNGRYGGSAIYSSTNINMGMYKFIDSQSTWIVGFALKTLIPTSRVRILSFTDATTIQCTLFLEADGGLSIRDQNGNSPPIASSNGLHLLTSVWYYIETKVVIHNSLGSVIVRVNGNECINSNNINTRSGTTNNSSNGFLIGNLGFGFASAYSQYFDDIYICDTSGSNNSFLGDVRIASIYPSGNGFYSQFARQGGLIGNNYLSVNDTLPDGDNTYVESSGTGNKDSYQYTNLPNVADSIKCVQLLSYARKTDAGFRNLSNFIRIGSVDYNVSSGNVPDSYQYLMGVQEANPSTGSAWTNSDINNLEAGIKLLS